MTVLELQNLIKQAMIQKRDTGDIAPYSVYKNILDKAQKLAKERLVEVNENIIIEAANKEIKQLNDTISYIDQNTDQDMYQLYVRSIGLAKGILPEMATEEDMLTYLTSNEVNKDMGSCMKSLRTYFGNRLDNKLASICAKKYIV